MWNGINTTAIKNKVEQLKSQSTYKYFDLHVEKFILSNKKHFNEIRFEAMDFICQVMSQYENMSKYISFSGGKDSTVVSDLVIKALGNASIPHNFCDTTLEYPFTLKYVNELKQKKPNLVIKIARNNEHDFYRLSDDIGVSTRMKRWYCTIFKTGVISKLIKRLFDDKKLIYFNGLRKSESTARSKYLKVSTSNAQKIQNRVSVSPIIDWIDADVWLYILSEQIEFNEAYRLGFPGVGCFCCPNGSFRNEILSKIYLSDMANEWQEYLLNFAKKTGVDNPERYVEAGLWKTKFGGSGIKNYKDISIQNKTCTIDENAVTYDVGKEITEELYTLFIPFGEIHKELGRKYLDETMILRNGKPIISIQKMSDNKLKIKTINVKDHNALHIMIEHQLIKYKLCRRCYKCEAVCPKKAISIQNDKYEIDKEKCVHCLNCTKLKYIHEGCMMKKYLQVKEEKSVE